MVQIYMHSNDTPSHGWRHGTTTHEIYNNMTEASVLNDTERHEKREDR